MQLTNLWLAFIAVLLAPAAALHAAEFSLAEPLDYQVIQRMSRTKGAIHMSGRLRGMQAQSAQPSKPA
ncbi:MAG: hypothetical protein JWM16_4159 [Verrucomicrobiales bacterium]|nr:hypothetical protein [Verrucomicrobiales bacterium]